MMLKKTKGLTWPFLALALATTLVYMAGLAAVQAECGSLTIPQSQGSGVFQRAAFGASDFTCHRMFRFYWFIFAFVMVTLLGLLLCAALKLALHWSRAFWVGMVTISALLMMIASEFFLGTDNVFDSTGSWPGSMHSRWRTATAGAIMSVVSLVLLLMAIGTDWDRFGHGSSHHRGRDEKVTGTTTTTTEAAYAGPPQNVRVVDQV